jgi:hypothetical protein
VYVFFLTLVFEHDDDAIPSEFDRAHLGSEGEFSNASVLMIVPDHHFVGRVARVATTTHQGQDVATEQHLDVTDATLVEI